VLADYGLLMTVGSLVNGRLWTLDTTAMLSAGRQSFATWAYQLYTPAFWKRYQVSSCTSFGADCERPQGPNVRLTTPGGANFVAVLGNQSGCTHYAFFISCTWVNPGEVGDRTWGPISDECRYDSTPGSTNAWRYGCNLGADPADLLDQKNGWQFATTACNLRDLTICKDVGLATLDHGQVHIDPEGQADVRISGSAPDPGPGTIPARTSVTLEHVAFEEDGQGEIVKHPDGVDLAPLKLVRVRGGTTRRARFAAPTRARSPRATATFAAPTRPREPPVTATFLAAHRTLRLVVRVQNARISRPDACLGARSRAMLETRLRIAYPSGVRVSEPMRARWTCTTSSQRQLRGLKAGR
jgi:hypothetical protein